MLAICGVPARRLRWNIYPRWLDQNVQDLVVGQLELFLRYLNVKYARHLQNFTNASHSRMSAMFVFHNPVLSLARPNFLTGAIIETRFQASLLTPPGHSHIINCNKNLYSMATSIKWLQPASSHPTGVFFHFVPLLNSQEDMKLDIFSQMRVKERQ